MMKTATPTLADVRPFAVETHSPTFRVLALRERGIHSIDLAEEEHCRLSIQEGSAWVTMEGCPDDFALTTDHPRAGFTGPGRLVIEALGGGVTVRISSENPV